MTPTVKIRKGGFIIELLEKVNTKINDVLAGIAGISLLLIVLLVVGNALARVIYKPFSGATEVVGWLGAIAMAFGLGYTQVHGGYVEINAVVDRFPKSIQYGIKMVMLAVSIVFFSLVSWQVMLYGLIVAANGNLSETMGIVFYPLILLVAMGFLTLTLALGVELIRILLGGRDVG